MGRRVAHTGFGRGGDRPHRPHDKQKNNYEEHNVSWPNGLKENFTDSRSRLLQVLPPNKSRTQYTWRVNISAVCRFSTVFVIVKFVPHYGMTLQNLDAVSEKIATMTFLSPNFFWGVPEKMWKGHFLLPTNLRRAAKFRRSRFIDGKESFLEKNI